MRGKTGGRVVWVRHARLKIDARLQRRPRDHRRHGHRQRHRQVHGHGQRVRLGRSVLFAARHQQRDVLDRPARARVWSGARGDHRQRSAGRRTRKNARARRNGRSLSRDPRGQFRRAKQRARRPDALSRGPVVRAAVEAGVEAAGVAASLSRRHALARARPHATPQALHAIVLRHGWRLTTARLHLVKGASAFAPALLSAETAAPHRAARLRHGARGDLPVRR